MPVWLLRSLSFLQELEKHFAHCLRSCQHLYSKGMALSSATFYKENYIVKRCRTCLISDFWKNLTVNGLGKTRSEYCRQSYPLLVLPPGLFFDTCPLVISIDVYTARFQPKFSCHISQICWIFSIKENFRHM